MRMKPELSDVREVEAERRAEEEKFAELERALASEVRVVARRVGKKRGDEGEVW